MDNSQLALVLLAATKAVIDQIAFFDIEHTDHDEVDIRTALAPIIRAIMIRCEYESARAKGFNPEYLIGAMAKDYGMSEEEMRRIANEKPLEPENVLFKVTEAPKN